MGVLVDLGQMFTCRLVGLKWVLAGAFLVILDLSKLAITHWRQRSVTPMCLLESVSRQWLVQICSRRGADAKANALSLNHPLKLKKLHFNCVFNETGSGGGLFN